MLNFLLMFGCIVFAFFFGVVMSSHWVIGSLVGAFTITVGSFVIISGFSRAK